MSEEQFNSSTENEEQVIMDVPHRGYETGTFVDGKTTTGSYLIIAVRKGEDEYNCVGIKRLGNNDYKYHFWPTDEFFGVVAPDRYDSEAGQSKGEYTGGRSDWDGVVNMLDLMGQVEGTTVATPEKVMDAYNARFPVVRSYDDSIDDDYDEDDEHYY